VDLLSSIDPIQMEKIQSILMWTFLGALYYSYILYQINNIDKIKKIEKLVDYNEIKKQINIIVFVTLFLLFKNVPNAI